MIREQDKVEIERVNKILCRHFDVSLDDFKGKNTSRICSLAKSYALYYLHTQKGMSATTLSRGYGLHRRVVFWHISKTKDYIRIYSTTRKEYDNICNLLNENQQFCREFSFISFGWFMLLGLLFAGSPFLFDSLLLYLYPLKINRIWKIIKTSQTFG